MRRDAAHAVERMQAKSSDATASSETKAQEAGADADTPDLVVIGSRIVRDGYSAPTQLTVLTATRWIM
ncbi:hypothetical protein [Sphingomonas profundi]|uniref:hypothetical protein n=1 Tax=Alterirhizorhabdus profundi TaxID=2681549 RepID=UPI0012E913AD|nr:hypothetical protein [Sphingomonas profundi]